MTFPFVESHITVFIDQVDDEAGVSPCWKQRYDSADPRTGLEVKNDVQLEGG